MRSITEWAQSKQGFYVPNHYVLGRWQERPQPIILTPYHRDILEYLFPTDRPWPHSTIVLREPAKSGKSAIGGLIAQYVALHGPGNSTIPIVSNSLAQSARITYDSVRHSVDKNPYLPNVSPQKLGIEFKNGNAIIPMPSNSRTIAGLRMSAVVLDEMWGFEYEDQERIWTELKTDPTREISIRVAMGYGPYTGQGKLWDEITSAGQAEPIPELAHIENSIGDHPACMRNGSNFTFYSTVCRQPWQTDEWIDEQRRNLRPAEFLRMIEARTAQGVGNFVSGEAWDACKTSLRLPTMMKQNFPVYVGVDLATAPGGDDCAIVGVFVDHSGKLRIAFWNVWRGRDRDTRLKLRDTVIPYLVQKRTAFNIQTIFYDPFQAFSLMDELRELGFKTQEVKQTHSTRGPKDTFLLSLVEDQRILIPGVGGWRDLAAQASVKELGNNLVFIIKSQGRKSKIDLLIALSNVADEPFKYTGNAGRVWHSAGIEDPYNSPEPSLVRQAHRPHIRNGLVDYGI